MKRTKEEVLSRMHELILYNWPRPRTVEPLIYRIHLMANKVVQVLSASVRTLPNLNIIGNLQSVDL